jgi:exosortase
MQIRLAEVRTSGRLVAVLPSIGLSVAVALFVLPAFIHGVEVWSTDEEFTYGFLIPPLVVGIIWWERASLSGNMGRGAWPGLLIVIAAMVLALIGKRAGIHALAGVATSPLLWGIAVYLWGWRAGRVLAFPLGFLVFGLGLYRGLLSSLGFALQNITAVGAAWSGHLLGLSVVRDGLILQSSSFAFVVAQTCSGMSSLLSLLALAALLVYATRGSLPGRFAVILSVTPLVLLANTARVTLVLVVATWFGQDAALGFFHGASSLVLFGSALGGVIAVSRVVGCRLPAFASSF